MFVDPANGDFRVQGRLAGAEAGLREFPDGPVRRAEAGAEGHRPHAGDPHASTRPSGRAGCVKRANYAWQAQIRDIAGLGDRSAYGLPDESGVLLLDVPAASPAAKAGLQKDDVILACNGQPVRTANDLQKLRDKAAGQKLTLLVSRKQKQVTVEVKDYAYVVTESFGEYRVQDGPPGAGGGRGPGEGERRRRPHQQRSDRIPRRWQDRRRLWARSLPTA